MQALDAEALDQRQRAMLRCPQLDLDGLAGALETARLATVALVALENVAGRGTLRRPRIRDPRGMNSWRQLLTTALLLAAIGGGYYAWTVYAPERARDERPPGDVAVAVRAATVEKAELHNRVEAVGTTRASRAIEVVPLASGRVVELLFEAGDMVAAGAPLVRLDDDIERADLAEAEALLREKELALERARTLRSTAAVSQATIDQLVAERATAQARVDRAARRLADRVVEAAFAGTVGLRRVDVGARVDDDTVLTTLDDLEAMEVAFQLPERLFGEIAPGQSVQARSAAFQERVFAGAIATLDSRIDVATRSFAVRAVLPNPDRALPAGMFMHLELVVASRMALVVPEEAILVTGDRAFVFAVEEGRAKRTEVVLGQREVGHVEIVSGLDAGARVVVEGLQRVRDGVAVEVEEPAAEGAPVAAADGAGASG